MAVLQGSAKSADVAIDSFYDYTIDQSLRFDKNSSANLSKTFATNGNLQTWTISCWVKRGRIETGGIMIGRQSSASNTPFVMARMIGDVIDFFRWNGSSSAQWNLSTSQVFRDPSAWYHLVFVLDTTQATASERARIYVNGERITAFATEVYPTQNSSWEMSYAGPHNIEAEGYLAEFHFTDGTAYTADDFGEFKSGVWVAKTPDVTYGTNGFYLSFNGFNGTTATDDSTNSNNWTATNLASTDVMLDSPTNNFATLNPIDINTKHTFSEGNLGAVLNASSNPRMTRGTCLVTSGKWYAEFTETVSTSVAAFGIVDNTASTDGTGIPLANSIIYFANGAVYRNGTNIATYATSTLGDVISVAMDLDGSTVEFFKNGVSLGAAISITTGNEYTFGAFANQIGDAFVANFGQDSSFAGTKTPQGNTDANGLGDFYYAPPTGYLALCTANLPEPAISPLNDVSPSDYFNTVLYTGNGTSQSINVGFATDFTWIKDRTGTDNHHLFDRIRGTNQRLVSNVTNAENTETDCFNSFDANGFSIGANTGVNASGDAHVAWNWLAGGTPVTNTDGTITSSVSANVDSGFSIVSYTGTGANATVGHGLNQAPELVIVKDRDRVVSWVVGAEPLTFAGGLSLDLTDAYTANSAWFNSTSPTSSVVSVGTGLATNYSGHNMIMYAFHSVEGFSKFGSYTGNGSADGPFVYTGFRPSWIMVKRADAAVSWIVEDTARDTTNPVNPYLLPNTSDAEASSTSEVDFLSNGFKIRNIGSAYNTSGGTYIYMAFAENPFKYSTAR